jgi:pyrroline-5-carboxylate reductase
MKLGFVGTGAMTSALVTGLSSAGVEPLSICLSPRNSVIAADLVNRFPRVSVASSNQVVLDECETVVLAVRPQIADRVLAELHFGPHHHVISIVSALRLRRLSDMLTPARRITRAVPLPLGAKRSSPTGIYPPDSAARDLFGSLGTVYEVDTEDEFDALCTTTASIASYFAFADSIASWLVQHGIPQVQARDYIARIFAGLANTAVECPERNFQSLTSDFATKEGINEQVFAHLVDRGVFKAVSEALDAVMERITATS